MRMPLFQAAYDGSLVRVRYHLAKGDDPNWISDLGTAAMVAWKRGHYACFQAILAAGGSLFPIAR